MNSDDSLRIVPATHADLPAVAGLAGVIWRRHYPGIITEAQIEYMLARGYSVAALRAEIDTPGHWLDLAVVDGRPVGYANAYLTGEPGEMKLDKLYLLQAYHGRGIGSRLLAHVAALARGERCERLILNVNKHNESSIGVYLRNGFRVRESVVVDIGSGYVMDDYVMELPL